jgi:hypothetical protein
VQSAIDFSRTWDAILRRNHQVIGSYGSDAHEGLGRGAPADFIDAPRLTLDSLMHSFFEGRLYMARNDFGGRIVFNLDRSSGEPFPARYPVYLPASRRSAAVHLAITGGLAPGETIRWIYNSGSRDHRIIDAVSNPSYDATKSIPLSGRFTFVRAEVRDGAGGLLASTEPIFFEDVRGLPTGISYHVDSVTPASRCDCSVAVSKGITASRWNSTSHTLLLTLSDRARSTVGLLLTSRRRPRAVGVDDSKARKIGSPEARRSARRRAWHYDASAHLLYLRALQTSGRSTVSIVFAPGPRVRRRERDLEICAGRSRERC